MGTTSEHEANKRGVTVETNRPEHVKKIEERKGQASRFSLVPLSDSTYKSWGGTGDNYELSVCTMSKDIS